MPFQRLYEHLVRSSRSSLSEICGQAGFFWKFLELLARKFGGFAEQLRKNGGFD